MFHINAPHCQPFNKGTASLCGQSTSKNLAVRQADFDKGSTSTDRQRGRWAAGGFHRPGSLKK